MNIIDKFKILTYNIGFVQSELDQVMTSGIKADDIIWMKHKYKDRFFADPFLLDIDEKYFYILCEEYIFWEEKGKITLLVVERDTHTLVKKKVVIEENTHLSFPFCELGGDYIIPESCLSGKCVKYVINKETLEVAEKEIVFEEGLIDTVFYEDANLNQWMFTSKMKIPSTELYIYKKGTDGFYHESHKNPVLSNNRVTRAAGAFFEWQGEVYRPVQDCKKRYGWQTKIMKINSLAENKYEAEEYITLNSFENPPFNETMHTFNVYDECIIVDGSKDRIRFPMKIFYKKCRFLFKRGKDK